MRKMNKKGFTIVELVIVIAVIAILAAVLIPTYSSLVKKANISADEQAVRQMNTALAIYTAENGKPDSVYDVKKAFDENLINTESLIPVTQGYAYYWNREANTVVLVSDSNPAKEGWELLSSTGYGKPTESADASKIADAITASSSEQPALVKLTGDVTLSTNLQVEANQCVIVDLNGHKITSGSNVAFIVEKGTLTVKNGTIETKDKSCVKNDGGDVTLRGVKIKNEEGTASTVYVGGISNTAIIDCEIESGNHSAIGTNSSADTSDGARLSVINSKLKGNYAGILVTIYADVTIDNCEIYGNEHGGFFRGCNAKISNSKFTHGNAADMQWGSGNTGPCADITFASGGTESVYSDYAAIGNYACDSVTAGKVIVHEPEGGSVTVSGDITITHTCHLASGETCNCDDNTCGKTN